MIDRISSAPPGLSAVFARTLKRSCPFASSSIFVTSIVVVIALTQKYGLDMHARQGSRGASRWR
jgi:hypothetical protein